MKLAFSQEMKKIDQLASAQYGLSSEVLMEAAGQAAATILHENYPDKLNKILVLVGPGNNGGDALVVSRHLHALGYLNQEIYFVSSQSKSKEYQLQMGRVQNLKIPVVSKVEQSYSMVIDGIFGIGLDRPIEGEVKALIETVNALDAFRFALDIPSGLNANTGTPFGVAVRANATVTFGLSKPAFYMQEGPSYTGKLYIKNIGFPGNLLDRAAQSVFLFDQKDAKQLLVPEASTVNKTHRGKVLVIAGSENFWGAGLLCCQAALRSGAGYVYWASYQSPIFNLPDQPELIVKPLDHIQNFASFDAVVVGPGLGVSEETYKLLSNIDNDNVILDADAITSIGKFGVRKLNPNWIITPHTGELTRITGQTTEQVESHRIRAVNDAHKKIGCNVLLKGFRTIVGAEKYWIVGSGNKALAKAGSGDVLAGIIGAFAAQKKSITESALLGAYVHGLIADQWVLSKSDRSLTPSDLIQELPSVLKSLEVE